MQKTVHALVQSQEFADKQAATFRKSQQIQNAKSPQKPKSNFHVRHLTEQKLVFLHLPKTGGTTLHSLLVPQFDKESICPERFNGLRHRAVGELVQYRYFSGHFDLPSVRLIPGCKQIITMLREPVSRLLSLYYFQRAHKIEVIERNNLKIARLANKYALADFFCADEVRSHSSINNAMTRVLTQCIEEQRWEQKDRSNCNITIDQSCAELAFNELISLDTFGIMEKYDDSVTLIFNTINRDRPAMVEKKQVLSDIMTGNPGLKSIEKERLTDEILNVIESLVQSDLDLYNRACLIFEQRLQQLPYR